MRQSIIQRFLHNIDDTCAYIEKKRKTKVVILSRTETNKASYMDEINTLQNKMNQSITSIENLSNELFHAIFDYVDGICLYRAFSNLNYRFQQLINTCFVLFKINDSRTKKKDIFLDNYKQMMIFNKHQIYSIQLKTSSYDNEFFTSIFIINSSFNHLESIGLWEIDLNILLSILMKLTSLPRLFSLGISIYQDPIDLTDIYRLVFNLPMLKFYQIYTSGLHPPISVPMAIDQQQLNNIENLNINHCFNFHELINIISYTPKIHRLKFSHSSKEQLNFGIILPSISLTNLTSMSIHSYTMTFDEWEVFIHQIRPKLKSLHFINQSEDINYLNGNRWEQFILKYLPKLEKFFLEYYESIDEDHIFPIYPGEPNQFASKFWIERQWSMNIDMDTDEIIYTIRPYKKHWYDDTSNEIINSSIDFSKSSRLCITGMHYKSSYKLLTKFIKYILTISPIYHLNIFIHKMSLNKLIQIIGLLPDINSLKIRSIDFNKSMTLSDDFVYPILEKLKITKVYIEEMISMREIPILTLFCPFMTYLKIKTIDLIDFAYCLTYLLEKIHYEIKNNLCSLCFHTRFADEKMIEVVKEMINNAKLTINYTIKRVLNNVYIQWKK